MKGLVMELVSLVGGRNGNGKRPVGQSVGQVAQGVKKKPSVEIPAAGVKEPRPEQVIPMEVEGLNEFLYIEHMRD